MKQKNLRALVPLRELKNRQNINSSEIILTGANAHVAAPVD